MYGIQIEDAACNDKYPPTMEVKVKSEGMMARRIVKVEDEDEVRMNVNDVPRFQDCVPPFYTIENQLCGQLPRSISRNKGDSLDPQ